MKFLCLTPIDSIPGQPYSFSTDVEPEEGYLW